ncbi:MAG: transposase [Deltaproteobacteria bacterium]|nr:transposase [Deltaproteobacteria bacterium]
MEPGSTVIPTSTASCRTGSSWRARTESSRSGACPSRPWRTSSASWSASRGGRRLSSTASSARTFDLTPWTACAPGASTRSRSQPSRPRTGRSSSRPGAPASRSRLRRHLHENDRHGLEALCRYFLRPPLAQDRLRLAPDGSGDVVLRLKRPMADGKTTLRMSPMVLLRRLAGLVPPPRTLQISYYGGFASHANLRDRFLYSMQRKYEKGPSHQRAVPKILFDGGNSARARSCFKDTIRLG